MRNPLHSRRPAPAGDNVVAGDGTPAPGMSRRGFIRTSTITATVAAAGLSGVLPSVLPSAEEDLPAGDAAAPAAAGDESGALTPVTAHIADPASGEISVFVEDRTIVLRDPGLAQSILRAAR